MKNLKNMSIDELEESLSQTTDPTSIAPVSAVLQSKTIRFLSSELAIFKQALCEDSRKLEYQLNALNENLSKTFQNIASLRNEIRSSTEVMSEQIGITRESLIRVSKSQEKYQLVLCLLTMGLILAALAQAWVVYWTSMPQRTIELMRHLDEQDKSTP